jgi:hypothetical protein
VVRGCVGGTLVRGVTNESGAFETSTITDRTQRRIPLNPNRQRYTALYDKPFRFQERTEFRLTSVSTKCWPTEFPDTQNI